MWGRYRTEGSSAIGDGGQAAILFIPDNNGAGSGSLSDSVLSILLKKTVQWCLGSGSFFLIIDDREVPNELWIAVATSVYHSIFRSYASQTNGVSSGKENPLATSCVVNVCSCSVTASSSCLCSSCLWASSSIRSLVVSSLGCTTRISMKSSSCSCSLK